MNRLRASIAAAVSVSALFVASPALADEEAPVAETPVADVPTDEAPVAPAPVGDSIAADSIAADSPAPVDADSNVAARDRERMRIGTLVGVGFPRPLAIEGFVKANRYVGIGAEYGFLPRTTISGAEIELKSAAADLRVFPFKNGFFVGVRGGRQWVDAKVTASSGPYTASASMNASTWFVNPRIGFLHTFTSGVTVGIDVGVSIPVAPELAIEHSQAAIADKSTRAMSSVANLLGNETTPTIDLLRVGFLF